MLRPVERGLERCSRWLVPLVVAPAVALGCYASTELEEADPGARLRQRVYRPASGPVALAGWHDTELDIACHFQRVEDGGYRCIPVAGPASMHFEDPECRRPVARFLDCTTPRFVRELVSPPSVCDGEPRSSYVKVFELDAPRSTARLYDLSDGACVESSAEGGELWGARRVPDETFVAAELAPAEEPTGRVTALELRGADGSRQLTRLFDRERGVECQATHPQALTGLAVPCLPVDTAYVRAGGPDCDVDVASPDGCGDPPPLAQRSVRDDCGRITGRTLYAVEETSVPSGDSCDVESSEGYLVREAGPDAVPWLTPTTIGAEGDRLRRLAWQSASGDTWPTFYYYDTELDVPCVPQDAPDGTLRCLPTGWLSHRAISSRETGPFADPACTELAVVLFGVRTCEEPSWVPVLAASESCEGASDIVSYHAVEEPIEATYRPDPTSGACVPDEMVPIFRAYRLGAAIAFERFDAGELVVE